MRKLVVVVKAVHDLARCLGGYRQEIEVERPITVSELLEMLSARYGEELAQRLRRRENTLWNVAIFVNGRNVAAGEGGATIIKDGDEVLLLSPISGG